MTKPTPYFNANRDDFLPFLILNRTGKFGEEWDISYAAGSLGSGLVELALAGAVDGEEFITVQNFVIAHK